MVDFRGSSVKGELRYDRAYNPHWPPLARHAAHKRAYLLRSEMRSEKWDEDKRV